MKSEEFLDMSVREVSGRLCEEICRKLQNDEIPMASFVADGTCEELGRVRLTVVLTKVGNK